MHRKISACLFCLTLVAAARPLWAQSLADLSKSEEERRKTIKAPSKVYTNKDLPTVPAPTATGTEPATAAEGAEKTDEAKDATKEASTDATKSGDETKGAEAVKDQAYWSGRVKDLQTQLERDQSYAEALQTRINALTTDFANRSDPAQRAVVEQDRLKALAELDRLTTAIQNDQKAIADLDEEARRSGVPPGWLR